MRRVRFWEVDGKDLNADGGYIEIADDGIVTMTGSLSFIADLRAPVDPSDMASASTCPTGGFEKVGEGDGRVVFRAVGAWDPGAWIDKVRYHFRTPYLRAGGVEIEDAPGQGGNEAASHRPSGLLDLHVDLDQPNDDEVNPIDYWFATGEGWEDIPPDAQARILMWLDSTSNPA
jgi:hypothetical protein